MMETSRQASRTREPVALLSSAVPAHAVIRQVLFPSDLSHVSDRAFDHARFLSEHFRAQLTLYHVAQTSGYPTDDVFDAVVRRSVKSAREHLERQAPAEGSAVVVESAADASRALVHYMREQRPDLTVMATHGRHSLSHFFLGSVAETVAERAGQPVLFVREPEHGVALPYRRILVPTDLSEDSRRAFPLAALFARSFGAEVLAVHVASVTAPPSLSGVSYEIEALPSERSVKQFLEPDFYGVRVTPRVLLGSTWHCIADTARTERVDVIVMSTHGYDSVADGVVGSHAQRVARQSPCPVLIV
jgi:nucleotide-binding universal stress UspA family protein